MVGRGLAQATHAVTFCDTTSSRVQPSMKDVMPGYFG
jgi:hypothetical protein